MISYETAKKLKAAGFPQHQFHRGIIHGEHADYAYHPILEELIEACGTYFKYLNFAREEGEKFWCAVGILDGTEYWGDTPIEAVANLWFALNK